VRITADRAGMGSSLFRKKPVGTAAFGRLAGAKAGVTRCLF